MLAKEVMAGKEDVPVRTVVLQVKEEQVVSEVVDSAYIPVGREETEEKEGVLVVSAHLEKVDLGEGEETKLKVMYKLFICAFM